VYQTLSESASFYKRYDKTCWCVFWFTLLTAVHLQIAVYGIDTIQARRKTFTFLYDKFTQDNIIEFYHNQFGFIDCISKNILVCFISVHRVDVSVSKLIRIWRISDILKPEAETLRERIYSDKLFVSCSGATLLTAVQNKA